LELDNSRNHCCSVSTGDQLTTGATSSDQSLQSKFDFYGKNIHDFCDKQLGTQSVMPRWYRWGKGCTGCLAVISGNLLSIA